MISIAHIYNKKAIIICDCVGCKNRPTWRQGFFTDKGLILVDLCEDHHFILRTKVPNYISLNEDVLKWLLIQDPHPNRVTKYGVLKGPAEIEMMKELNKIDLEFD